MSVRILIADDSVVFRRAVADALAGVPDVEIVGTAANGRLALSRLESLAPDLMTLDVEMPELNGIDVLRQMKAGGSKTGVIVVSSLTKYGGELTVRALELGAFDFVTKPEGGTAQQNLEALRAGLVPQVQAFMRQRARRAPLTVNLRTVSMPAPQPLPQVAVNNLRRTGAPIVLIGVSTGGPAALASLIPSLPASLNAPVFIVQHMPALFTQPLAASLSAKSKLPVAEARDGETAANGRVYLAPGGRHMKIVPGPHGDIIIRVTDDAPENNCRPAVDYLFRSAALYFPGRSVAVVLTGMGCDGTAGLRMLKRDGCLSIAQDEASSVVFGMPKEAIQAGVVDVVAPLREIGGAIIRAVGEAHS